MALSGSGVVGLWDWMVGTNLLHGDAQFARVHGLDVASAPDFGVEYRLTIPSEALRRVECRRQMIADAAGRPVRFSGTAIDITERHRSEVALQHLNDTLEQRVAERTDELNFFWDS